LVDKKELIAMNKKNKAAYILKELQNLYPNPKPALDFKDHYTLLISVLLSAQCTDKKVNQITPLLFSKADTPEKMIKLGQSKILEIIRPCGLSPQKSKAIFELSKILINEHKGEVPSSFEELEKLPGVGHKTASVVMAQGFHVPAFPVDTHIFRLARRWKLSRGNSVKKVEEDLKNIFPKDLWNSLHLQIIYYGREHCKARSCDGKVCPICSHVNS
jgi:endonuclease-3